MLLGIRSNYLYIIIIYILHLYIILIYQIYPKIS